MPHNRTSVEQLRASNRQLELFTLELDELIAMVDADLLRQQRGRLEKRVKIE
ncbi:MAG: hypothetical protein HC851_16835 [Acaryochloris sp. RU_4_1]|nr:hypothetical protein [Acaryochloris sp. RU_4_1]NJR52267.1 hypothetical protein [Leptolyngbyaceae cyanobacterium CSU_1_3]NJR55953.1 hypothetical protein [Acaryochloris sp. CRU_2_0]